jgi:hypothetical protein
VRRKFDEARVALPEQKRSSSEAAHGLSLVNELFALERSYQEMVPDRRRDARKMHSVPQAREIFSWARGVNALPKSLLGRAIDYLLDLECYLMRVFDDGRLELSNNRAERSVKPFVIGRKNWLFSNTPRGAEASAAFFSIIETAKENDLNVYEYLKYLFERLPSMTTLELDGVMPWSDSLPEYVKVPTAYTP